MLEKYQHKLAEIGAQQPVSAEQAWTFQELLYRIGALQACQTFCAAAPVGDDMQAMYTHYQMVDGYLEPNQYKTEILKTITTFLPAWIQSRNAYTNINSREAQ